MEDDSIEIIAQTVESNENGSCVKKTTVLNNQALNPGYFEHQCPLPEWVNDLLEYFKFTARERREEKEGIKTRSRDYFTLSCILCTPTQDRQNSKKESKITGCNSTPFARHLKRIHSNHHKPEVYEKRRSGAYKRPLAASDDSIGEINLVASVLKVDSKITASDQPQSTAKKYDENGARQKTFDIQVLDFVIRSGISFSVAESDGFRLFIHGMNPSLTCPSRKKLMGILAQRCSKISEHLKVMLKDFNCHSQKAHLILDIWSSRQRISVIGVQVRFIKGWAMQQFVLGFKQFDGSHDATNIRKKLENLLLEDYGVSINQFATVTADNASAILCAFKDQNQPTYKTMTNKLAGTSEFGKSNNSDSEEEDMAYENQIEVEEDFITCGVINDAIEAVILEWSSIQEANSLNFSSASIRRNSCLAHLLQLGIKDGLKHPTIAAVIKKVNSIVSWFHKSNKHDRKLYDITKLCLVKPCETRWNSTYYSLKRLCDIIPETNTPQEGDEEFVSETVASAVNIVLHKARSAAKNVPQPLTPTDVTVVETTVKLLQPFTELTDLWQGDGVTSSTVISGIINAIQELDSIEINNDSDLSEELLDFKKNLRICILQRFETDKDNHQTVVADDGSARKIVTLDVFNDRFYILSSLLDPRVKTTPFEDVFINGLQVRNGHKSVSEVTEMLRSAFKLEEIKMSTAESQLSASAIANPQNSSKANPCKVQSDITSLSKPNSKRLKRSLFSRISDHQNNKQSNLAVNDEIERYLLLGLSSEGESPLKFWKLNEKLFPVLSRLACNYLAMPATSASVERLFSVAGAIISARRAALKIKTTEEIILYREYLRKGYSLH